MKPKKAIWKNL